MFLRAGLGITVLFVCACSGQHMRLVSPAASPGARYTCSELNGCKKAQADVPSALNPSGTIQVNLPEQCHGQIHQILILNAGSATPELDVTCAPAEKPIEPMK